MAGELAVVDPAERELAIGNRLLRGGLEGHPEDLGVDQALDEGIVDNSRDLAPRRGRVRRQADGAEPEDAIDPTEAQRDLSYADTLVLDNETANGDRVGVLLPKEEARAISNSLSPEPT